MSSYNVVFFILLSLFLTLIHSKQIHGYSNSSHINVAGCIEVERKILLRFKQGLDDPYGVLSSWHGKDCCNWSGIGCGNRTSYITKLDLRGSCDEYGYPQESLMGKLDISLFELKYLQYLDLSCNNFESSAIPSSIGSLRRLRYLNLSSIVFSGMVPPHLGNLSNLLYLDLNNEWNFGESWVDGLNWVFGLPLLKYLNLGSVDLSSASTSWLQAANKLSSIEELHFPGCNLHDLPYQSLTASNFTSLAVLDLHLNDFEVTDFDWLSNITTLTHLNIREANIKKSIDTFPWKHLCNLQTLDLSSNGMRGELNEFIDGLSQCSNVSMEELNLWNNKLRGHLPQSLGQLKNLRILDLFLNLISGPVPMSIGNLSHLIELSLGANELNGPLSETNIGKLEGLVSLNLESNNWVGVISEIQLLQLKNLKHFSLSSKNKTLAFDVSPNWVPSFSLTQIDISNCQMDPRFPLWLKTQTELSFVSLENLGMRGEIPSWFWELISPQLIYLSLSNNQLSGKFLKVLRLKLDPYDGSVLDLSFNMFEGSPPIVLQVSYLLLRNNSFSGPIPAKIGSQMPRLLDLVLSENSLTGNIPVSLGKLKNLRLLSLSSNNLSGRIPKLKGFPSLVRLDLSMNDLIGRIPQSLCSLPRLEELILNNNNLSGNIAALRKCTFLSELRLGHNHFFGNIPRWIREIPHLSILSIRGNSFRGIIPKNLCRLSYLHILDLSHNNLSGIIPSCVGSLTGMTRNIKYESFGIHYMYGEMELSAKGRLLTYALHQVGIVNLIDLSWNNLNGKIPEGLTNLSMLRTLNLSYNQLTGNLPEKIGQLTRLETLDLSSNHLRGAIPRSITSMVALSHLNLSYNNLSGQIPSTNQFLTLNEDHSIYKGNLYLCGSPWLKSCSTVEVLDRKDPPQGRDENKNDDEKYFDILWFNIGLGFGVIVGFWVVCGPLAINQSWRHQFYQFLDKARDVIYVAVTLRWARWHRKWKAQINKLLL